MQPPFDISLRQQALLTLCHALAKIAAAQNGERPNQHQDTPPPTQNTATTALTEKEVTL